MTPNILYEDNHLLVINKPAGLLAQADATGDPDVLTVCKRYLKEKYAKPGEVFLGLVHRLDRPATGVMVLARTSKAAARLSEQIRSRSITKTYWVLFANSLDGSGIYEDFLRKHGTKVHVVPPTTKGAQFARLGWKSIQQQNGYTLVEVSLETGRPHQIRVQFSSRGKPVMGDVKYGAKTAFADRSIGLHCREMSFKHPTQDKVITVIAPPPPLWNNMNLAIPT